MRRILFVATHDKFGTTVEEGVEDRVDLGPGHTEDISNSICVQCLDHPLSRARFVFARLQPPSVWRI
ncbi:MULTISPECIES: hypothetical protein [Mycobacterium avium complex (MAC)]|jgi:hypothetical protein|uniref:Uncharacterized protein n=1 Tax=Mycobacterium avium subsp. hominissuis TaxID=439334 RepID=A0AAI8SLM0_MYCAV|nr:MULTISPECIES: hypothetical protein [Mycobacterium avium complex (MAC)]ETB46419.1 hypothetical protein O981_28075 [Mycobacterium avium 10-5560]ETZ41707.1 hypothetical protein L838_4609 [Mycobacterium avium MAV_120709_2344]ETZ74829.1 hypothetical protein L841_0425 [Mycobacterium sp. MAC_080597_8934]KBR67133.1 hypothetical protein X425_00493 [Mycobacterium avium XTB13-223]MDO2357245.1 hypothetical protein [Mycobacterium avium subsp. hominissuis]